MSYDPPIERGLPGKTRYSYWRTLNCDRTRGIYIKQVGGFDALGFFVFDPVNLIYAASAITVTLDFNDLVWHHSHADKVIGHVALGRAVIIRDVTGVIADATYTMGAAFPANGYIEHMSVSADSATFAFTVRKSDAPDQYSVLGYGWMKTGGTEGYYAKTDVDEVQVDRLGTNIVVKDTATKVFIRPIPTGTLITINPGAESYPGHSDVGTTHIVGYDTVTNKIYAWALADGTKGAAWYDFAADYTQGIHFSLGSVDTEVLVSTYKVDGSVGTEGTLENQIAKITSAGVVTPIVSHRSKDWDGYWSLPKADWCWHATQGLDFICYTSNFGVATDAALEVVITRGSGETMGLETGVTKIADLDSTWPLGTDERSAGDDHLRNIKIALKSLLTDINQIRLGPASLSGQAGKHLQVNAGETAYDLVLPYTPSVQVFTASGTWTKPTGCTRAYVQCVGGGGGGAGGTSSFPQAGGGGGGMAEMMRDVSAVTSRTVTIGAGGAGGVGGGSGNPGGDGGTTSWGSDVVAAGGTGATSSNGFPGTGGIGTAGNVLIRGADGFSQDIDNLLGGHGGSSSRGGGGYGGSASHAAGAGGAYGAGGGGGAVSQNGGAGAAGLVVVWEY